MSNQTTPPLIPSFKKEKEEKMVKLLLICSVFNLNIGPSIYKTEANYGPLPSGHVLCYHTVPRAALPKAPPCTDIALLCFQHSGGKLSKRR